MNKKINITPEEAQKMWRKILEDKYSSYIIKANILRTSKSLFENKMKEIEHIIKIPDNQIRLKFVLLDNLIELLMFDLIKEKSFDEWMSVGGSHKPEKRINLYRFYSEKIFYLAEKGMIKKNDVDLLNIFHNIRNILYHQGFSFTNSFTNLYNDGLNIYVDLFNQYIYFLVKLFDIKDTHIKKYAKKALKINLNKNLFLNIRERIDNFKNDLVIVETAEVISFNRKNKKEDILNYQHTINHLVFNYGHEIIEGSSLDYKDKLKILKRIDGSPDYVDIYSISKDDIFFTAQEILNWEKIIESMKKNKNVNKSIKNWYQINKKLYILEELMDYYKFTGC